jgi:hypothetical protein
MRGGEAVHEAGDGGTFFGHADEDLAGLAVGVEADGDVAFVAGDGELVGERGALVGEAMADGARGGLDARSSASAFWVLAASAAMKAVVAPRMDFERSQPRQRGFEGRRSAQKVCGRGHRGEHAIGGGGMFGGGLRSASLWRRRRR